MKKRNQLMCLNCTIPMVLLVGVGGFLVTGFLPPPAPSLSMAETAAIFSPDNWSLRIGLALLGAGSPLFLGTSVALWAQLRRIESAPQVLSLLQLLCATVGILALQFPAYFMLAITYRVGIPPEIIVVVKDISFFILICAFAPAVMQNVVVGLCILLADRTQTVYPRWIGWACLWFGLAITPAALCPFFLEGPFTYSGLFGFWVVALGFFLWLALIWWYTLKAIQQENAECSPK